MFICTGITPSVAVENIEEYSMSISNSKTLYVGGTGEGNYTKIQDAINDASNGDTVFVYDDSSPYYEHIYIVKSINLIGEDKNTTVIDGELWAENSNDLVIQGFTIVKGEEYTTVVFVYCSNCTFYDNIVQIYFRFIGVSIRESSEIKILKNHITGPGPSIEIWKSQNCIIENNYIGGHKNQSIIYWSIGIGISKSTNINVVHNHISRCANAINIWSNSTNITIIHNHISRCFTVIEIFLPIVNVKVIENNFILNRRKYIFNSNLKVKFNIFWDGNYWGRPRIIPKLIFGSHWIYRNYDFDDPRDLLMIIPWFNIDWHPAKEPYKIEGVI